MIQNSAILVWYCYNLQRESAKSLTCVDVFQLCPYGHVLVRSYFWVSSIGNRCKGYKLWSIFPTLLITLLSFPWTCVKKALSSWGNWATIPVCLHASQTYQMIRKVKRTSPSDIAMDEAWKGRWDIYEVPGLSQTQISRNFLRLRPR